MKKIKKKIDYFLQKNNPLIKRRIGKMRKKLQNTNITLFAPNCMGGTLFHDLNLQFRSPTINLMMYQTDFVKLVCNMDFYLNEKFEFFKSDKYTCPCAHLADIDVHFTHYATPEIAENKWNERKKRIDKNNLFIFLEERDNLTKEDILRLSELNCRGIVVFTANEYPDIPYTMQIKKYYKDGEVGNILRRSLLNDSKEYEKYFDFVKWFNEANGKDYDITPYIIRN